MAHKKVKVKDIAEKFGLSPKAVINELEKEGIELKSASSPIPEDLVELVDGIMAECNSSKKQNSGIKEITLQAPIAVKDIVEALELKANQVVAELMKMKIMANVNQTIKPEVAKELCTKFNAKLTIGPAEAKPKPMAKDREDTPLAVRKEDKPEDQKHRPPIITFLGHVDHGKTSLQDYVRKTHVTKKEAGGITQHIGATSVEFNGSKITFIDTPGHEAFNAMRERGANLTDIAILVIAADDGFKPQTLEALKFARAANVPIIVAINKCDLPAADPDKILLQMQQNELMSEDWGGDIAAIRVSAMTGEGVPELLERVILESEMLELKANPSRPATGTVLEAQLEQGLGPTAHVLITNGTLKVGDPAVCGEHFGKIKALIDGQGKRIKTAGPSTPVKVVGLSGAPETSDQLFVCASEKAARKFAEERAHEKKVESLQGNQGASLDDLFGMMSEGKKNNLKLVLKTDVKGSGEAIIQSFDKLPSEKIGVNVVYHGVGAITESDVIMASTSGAILAGFHVRVNPGVNKLAQEKGVEIRLYSIIYELLQDIEDALLGRLDPDKREISRGKGTILQIFATSKGPNICGCMIDEGSVKLGYKVRVYREEELIYNGEVKSLRRFQDDVKEVKAGLECGIKLDNFKDFLEGDKLEFYDIELTRASL
jgi:translation initiation factor IF-2